MEMAYKSVTGCMLRTMQKPYLRSSLRVKPADYNIGGHNEKTNLEVVQAICDLLEELAPQNLRG